MADENEPPSPDSVPVKLNFRVLGRMPSVYAHHMSIQPGEHEVVLSFFEVITPPLVGPSEELVKHIMEAGLVAECVARITIANERFPAFAKAMQGHITTKPEELDAKENAIDSRDAEQN